jgi:hypothetical protein
MTDLSAGSMIGEIPDGDFVIRIIQCDKGVHLLKYPANGAGIEAPVEAAFVPIEAVPKLLGELKRVKFMLRMMGELP